ncbi:MAG: hypothetical protein ACE14S_09275 [Candidatus Bathyarchaeia archaeon]
MPKTVLIQAVLLKEAYAESNSEIAKAILDFLEQGVPRMPWLRKIQLVKVNLYGTQRLK